MNYGTFKYDTWVEPPFLENLLTNCLVYQLFEVIMVEKTAMWPVLTFTTIAMSYVHVLVICQLHNWVPMSTINGEHKLKSSQTHDVSVNDCSDLPKDESGSNILSLTWSHGPFALWLWCLVTEWLVPSVVSENYPCIFWISNTPNKIDLLPLYYTLFMRQAV